MINKILFFIFRLLYILVCVITFLGFMAPYVPIKWLPTLQLIPIFIPYLIPIHILGVIVISWKNWRLRSVAIICLGICIWITSFEFRFNFSGPKQNSATDLRVVSYNVESFHYRPEKYLDTLSSIFSKMHPDLICFQEFNNKKDKSGIEFLAVLSDRLQLPYRTFYNVSGSVGGAILSKYPIVEDERLYGSKTGANIGMWAIVETPERRVGVYNLHLASYRFGSSYSKHKRKHQNYPFKSLFLFIWERAFEVIPEQERMAYIIFEHATRHQGNIIISGDMNSVPYTRIPVKFRKEFQDSYLVAGRYYGMTYPMIGPFGMRIDYQFSSTSLRISGHQILPIHISDHYPIVVDYQFVD